MIDAKTLAVARHLASVKGGWDCKVEPLAGRPGVVQVTVTARTPRYADLFADVYGVCKALQDGYFWGGMDLMQTATMDASRGTVRVRFFV